MFRCENSLAKVQDLLNEALSLPQMSGRVLPGLCVLFHMCLCTQSAQICGCMPHGSAADSPMLGCMRT